MSYRHYLYAIDKDKLDLMRNLSKHELEKQYGEDYGNGGYFLWPPHLLQDCIFEYGSYSDFSAKILPLGKDVFTNKDVLESTLAEKDFVEVGKDAILLTIEEMRVGILDQYKKWLENPESGKHTFSYRIMQWSKCPPYNINENTPSICNADPWEYLVFELARILKTFDWENRTLIFAGY